MNRPLALLLAAGRGARFDASGRSLKQLAPAPAGDHAGQPMALAATLALRAAGLEVLAVVRPASEPHQPELHALLRQAGCALVENPAAESGIGSSIACGVAAVASRGGWLIALADMPAIRPQSIAAVAQALVAGAPSAAPEYHGQRGHPVGFAAQLRDELLALRGDSGARSVLAAHPPQLIQVEDAGVLIDIDSPCAPLS